MKIPGLKTTEENQAEEKMLLELSRLKPNTLFNLSFKNKMDQRIKEGIESLQAKQAEKIKTTNPLGSFKEKFASVGRFLFQKPPAFAFAILAVIVLFSAVYLYVGKDKARFAFKGNPTLVLYPEKNNDAGIDPATSFIFKSSEKLKESVVEKIVVFEPKIAFRVKEIKSTDGLVPQVSAAAEEKSQEEGLYQYKITPENKLEEDSIYKISIDAEGVGERDYQWAWQVKAPFSLVSSSPRDEANGVPINTGIELLFNRSITPEIQKLITISPSVPFRIEIKENKVTLIPEGGLKEKQVYQIKIAKGVTMVDGIETTSKDYSFSFETESKREEGVRTQEDFDFSKDIIQTSPFKNSIISLYSGNGEFEVKLYKFANAKDFKDSYLLSRNWDYRWSSYSYEKTLDQYRPTNVSEVASFTAETKEVEWRKIIEFPTPPERGYYFFTVKQGDKERGGYLHSSNSAYYYSLASGNGLLWLFDARTKAPINKASLSVIEGKESASKAMGVTKENGLMEFAVPSGLEKDIMPWFWEINVPGEEPEIVPGSNPSKGDSYWDVLTADRDTYLPNDEVRYWAIVKGRDKNLRDSVLTVGIYENYISGKAGAEDIPLVAEKKTVSISDTLEGKLALTSIKPGGYMLVVSGPDGELISQKWISVETYDKPAYQISTEVSKDAVFTGEKVEFKIFGKFYDGTPNPGTTVDYRISYGSYSEEKTLVLDQEGKGMVAFTPNYIGQEQDDYFSDSKRLYFFVHPHFAEEGEITSESSVEVFQSSVILQPSQEKIKNETHRITVKANRTNLEGYKMSQLGYSFNALLGDPVGGQKIHAKLFKKYYESKEDGEYYDYLTRSVKKKYAQEEKKDLIEEWDGQTSKQGDWVFEKELPATGENKGLRYFFVFSTQDEQSKVASDSLDIKSADWDGYIDSGVNFKMSIDGGETNLNSWFGQSFREKEKVKISANLLNEAGEDMKPKQILFYRLQNDIQRAWISDQKDQEEVFSQDLIPSVQYRAVVFWEHGFLEAYQSVAYNNESKKLEIKINPNQEKYRPGEEIKLDLEVKDQEQKGVPAEVNVFLADEALSAINPSWSLNVADDFYQAISFSPTVSFTEYNSLGRGDGMGGCFVGQTKITMANGNLKNIEEIKRGDQILTFSQEKKALVKAVVQETTSHKVDGYLVINQKLRVTEDHPLWSGGQWQKAGSLKEGEFLTLGDGSEQRIWEIKKETAPQTEVYNLIIGKEHTYLANGFFAHNDGKGGGGNRVDFKDLAGWAVVKADKDGKAHAEFKAPDDITSWRAIARAYEPEKMTGGSAYKLIPVSLGFFGDIILNDTYMAGDEPEIKVRASGTSLDKDKPVTYKLESPSLGLNIEKTLKENIAWLSLGKLPLGSHALTVTVTQGNKVDKLTKKIEVKNGLGKEKVFETYQLKEGMGGIGKNAEGTVELVFTSQSKASFYPDFSKNVFAQGSRLDQLAASFFSQKALQKYFKEDLPQEELKLDRFFRNESGLSIFGDGPADLEFSAKMADLAGEQVYKKEMAEYFNKELYSDLADTHRVTLALYGSASLGEPVLNKVQKMAQSNDLLLEDYTYLGLALAKLGDNEGARKIYDQKIKVKLAFENGEAFLKSANGISSGFTSPEKVTAVIGILAAKIGHEDMYALNKYLLNHDPEKELDILEEVMLATAGMEKQKDKEALVEFSTKARKESFDFKKEGDFSLNMPKAELDSLKINKIKGTVGLAIYFEEPVSKKTEDNNPNISLVRSYSSPNGEAIKDGDLVTVELKIGLGPNASGDYSVSDVLPAGLKPLTGISEGGMAKVATEIESDNPCEKGWNLDFVEGNRLIFDLYSNFLAGKGCTSTLIKYHARVVSKGKFQTEGALFQSSENPLNKFLGESANIVIQ